MGHQGQIVSTMEPIRIPWQNLYEAGQFHKAISVRLFHCFDEVPPIRKTTNVKRLGTLTCALDVNYSELPKFKSKKSVMVRKLGYEIELIPSGASVQFVLYVGGRKQGSEKVDISFA